MIPRFFKPQIAFLVIGAIIISSPGCNQQDSQEPVTETSAPVTAPETEKPQTQVDYKVLAGDWERIDAPYQLKVSELLDDGTMKAGYFNPKSINVGKATWIAADGLLRMYVELRDVNYPGSNYTLTYSAGKDVLIGKYYQAVEGATYDVSFTRKK